MSEIPPYLRTNYRIATNEPITFDTLSTVLVGILDQLKIQNETNSKFIDSTNMVGCYEQLQFIRKDGTDDELITRINLELRNGWKIYQVGGAIFSYKGVLLIRTETLSYTPSNDRVEAMVKKL